MIRKDRFKQKLFLWPQAPFKKSRNDLKNKQTSSFQKEYVFKKALEKLTQKLAFPDSFYVTK